MKQKITRYIMFVLLKTKNKEKILNTARGENRYIMYRRTNIRIAPDFSSETMQERKTLNDILGTKRKTVNPQFYI